ncbi:MAG: bifunctional rhamnulose-1-phosphate aldolase/short-chain dehydrogenase [Candidatus Eremiobacteraeota bacterium]|nr:bifunctional rhamnulose-1-phosphate aldolase/short-chain dehydrogenase [Candidatus Eremiobacteraeota bacterium]
MNVLAATVTAAPLAGLVARSRALGADRSVCNWGGGNTSTKLVQPDHLGRPTRVMWVKGSGSDLATVTAASFTALRLDDVLPLLDRVSLSDGDMVAHLRRCEFEPDRPRCSIETLMHAFHPASAVDHTHADATNYFACAADGERFAREVFGDELIWVPYMRPGFRLSRFIAEQLLAHPNAKLVILQKHGLITWGSSDADCTENTRTTLARARDFVEARVARAPAFGGARCEPLAASERAALVAEIAPLLRGLGSKNKRCVLLYDDAADALAFASSVDGPRLAAIGAACPDHLVHTKVRPLFVDWLPSEGAAVLPERIERGFAAYAAAYARYLDDNATQNLDPDAAAPVYRAADAPVDPTPRIVLIPGIGLIATGKDSTNARIASELYHRAIAVIRGAEALGGFASLTDEESHAVEFWPLEQYKLKLAPPEREFARQIAFVTGAGGGIGSAVCRRLARDGAHIIAADIDLARAQTLCDELNAGLMEPIAYAVRVDVTDEKSVRDAFARAAGQFGGIDIVVSNAGISSSAPIAETSLGDWQRNHAVLVTGYFLVAREAFRLFATQKIGGNIVFVASKNGLVAGKNASAYSSAKAAELHLARCLAEEGGAQGIRVNTVNPDAVLEGSLIWNSDWRRDRAATYGIEEDRLEEHYRKRTVLGVNVVPADIAEAVAFLASPSRSTKSTGNIINVDGGVTAAYPR